MPRTPTDPGRQTLPSRRRSWTQKAHVGGQTVYLSVGEYEDGRPGEIWLEAARAGTFVWGVLGALARAVSVALQCGVPLAEVVKALGGLCFPPDGPVAGSAAVAEASSVADYVARELAAAYLVPERPVPRRLPEGEGE